jgi:hypothetical protein
LKGTLWNEWDRSTNYQAPNPNNDQNKKDESWKVYRFQHWNLELGIYLELGAWSLGFQSYERLAFSGKPHGQAPKPFAVCKVCLKSS